MFVELPGGHIVNTEHIVRLKDITGTGHYRMFMLGGFTLDVAPDEASVLTNGLLSPPPSYEHLAELSRTPQAPPAEPKRKPGRPKKVQATT